MKKIVFADQCLGTGGAERVMATVIRSLCPNSFDIHLVLISNYGPLTSLIPDYVKKYSLGITNTRKAFFSFVHIMRKIRPDVVFVTSSRMVILALTARLLCPNYKVVARYSSMPGLDIQKGILFGWRLVMTKLFYRSADCVIAQTKEMADELEQYLKIPYKKLHTIHNPVDVEFITNCLCKEKTPFEVNTLNIVASGTIYPVKGFDVLLKAFALVHTQNKQFRLHILGSDYNDNREKLLNEAKKLKIAEHVFFHGFQPNPYIFYDNCDLFVLSSRREAMPNVLLECLYLGKPVIATRCAPVIERLINDGENGFIVDVESPGQMALAILKHGQLHGVRFAIKDNGIVKLIESIMAE